MYGTIQDGQLVLSDTQSPGYKPVQFAPIPDDFDQTTQYCTQTPVMDGGDYISAGVTVQELPPDQNGGGI